jgi:hypothetical protein
LAFLSKKVTFELEIPVLIKQRKYYEKNRVSKNKGEDFDS